MTALKNVIKLFKNEPIHDINKARTFLLKVKILFSFLSRIWSEKNSNKKDVNPPNRCVIYLEQLRKNLHFFHLRSFMYVCILACSSKNRPEKRINVCGFFLSSSQDNEMKFLHFTFNFEHEVRKKNSPTTILQNESP